MQSLFGYADCSNQPLADWVASSVTAMNWMFLSASSINTPIGNRDVSIVTKREDMFESAGRGEEGGIPGTFNDS